MADILTFTAFALLINKIMNFVFEVYGTVACTYAVPAGDSWRGQLIMSKSWSYVQVESVGASNI